MKTVFTSNRGFTRLQLMAETDNERALLSDLFLPTRLEKKKRIQVRFTTLENTPKNPNEVAVVWIEKTQTIHSDIIESMGFYLLDNPNKIPLYRYKNSDAFLYLSGKSKLYRNVNEVIFGKENKGFNLVSMPNTVISKTVVNSVAELEKAMR